MQFSLGFCRARSCLRAAAGFYFDGDVEGDAVDAGQV